MKLLHVVASYLPAVRYGGTIVSVHGLCRALAARGHDVHVFTTSVDGANNSDVLHGVPVVRDGVSVWYFESRHLRRIYRAPALGAALAARVEGFDAVHTHAVFLWPLWAAARAARRAGVPYVVSPRGMLERDLIAARTPLMKALWIAAIERRNLAGAAAIHVTSAREADEAAALGLDLAPIREIPNGVELPVIDGGGSASIAAIVDGPPYVLFLGRLSWKKGLDRLLPALARVPDARLVIAGNDDEGYRGVLDALIVRYGVADRVIVAGPVHGADKTVLLSAARLTVLPSYSENFGNVVVEAMAAACPVLVTPEVGLAPMVQESGAGIVAGGDTATLARALNELWHDDAARREMSRRGRATVTERFSWDVVATQMEALYQSIGRRRPYAA